MKTDGRLFTTGHVAELLGVSARVVQKWVDRGDLEGYKLPNSKDRRITRKGLLAFIRKTPYITESEFEDKYPLISDEVALPCRCGQLPKLHQQHMTAQWAALACHNTSCPVRPSIGHSLSEVQTSIKAEEVRAVAIKKWNFWISGVWESYNAKEN